MSSSRSKKPTDPLAPGLLRAERDELNVELQQAQARTEKAEKRVEQLEDKLGRACGCLDLDGLDP